MQSENYVNSALERLNKTFDLIMISEYLYESLVLFKHDVCLTTDDVASLSKNIAVHKVKALDYYCKLFKSLLLTIAIILSLISEKPRPSVY